jgi:hypothetical protein
VTELLPHHQALIKASAISEEVALARGYRSVTTAKELDGLFGPVQRRAPGLLIPLRGVYGELRAYQLRPDEPRVKDGRVIRYETPRGLKMMLDCPPSTLEHVRNPKVRLWVTEGVRKVDSLASVGLRALALLGVDCWRGTNEAGGKTILEDWYGVALSGRRIVICFDSDAFQKPEVHAATERVGRWLESRGAELSFVYLPHAEDGSKQGVDDFLFAHSRDDLLDRIETVWHPLPHETATRATPAPDVALRPTSELLVAVRDVFQRFVVLPSAAARLAVALYVLHTWAFEGAHCTPYLVYQSAAKRSGKTRAEEVLELLVRAPWRISAASESAMFRKIDAQRPTLLLDEVDAIFGAKTDGTEPIRAILNAGNRPGASVARIVGERANMQVADFSVYCPKTLAGIITSRWPDTVTDRSIVIRLQRKKRDESVARLRYRKLAAETEQLRRELERWAQEHVKALREAEPELPAGLDDRAAESWEPLLAIAELAEREGGEDWASHARSAARALAAGRAESEGHGVIALAAIRGIFGVADELHTTTIVKGLNADESLPFVEYRKGAGLNSRGLAKLLDPFAIRPHPIRIEGVQARGYRREQFTDSWARYCDRHPPGGYDPSHRHKPSDDGRFGESSIRHSDPAVTDREMPRSPVSRGDVTVGRIETCEEGGITKAHAEPAATRAVADLSDEELTAFFPGSMVEAGELDAAPCRCGQRTREWRLCGEALDVSFAYVGDVSYRAAIETGRDVLKKGKRSGWVWETTRLGRGHTWQCAVCHPPADCLDVEWRQARQ